MLVILFSRRCLVRPPTTHLLVVCIIHNRPLPTAMATASTEYYYLGTRTRCSQTGTCCCCLLLHGPRCTLPCPCFPHSGGRLAIAATIQKAQAQLHLHLHLAQARQHMCDSSRNSPAFPEQPHLVTLVFSHLLASFAGRRVAELVPSDQTQRLPIWR